MIDAALNFVVPLYRDDGTLYAYVHSRPISAAAFDMSYRLLIRTFNNMLEEGPVASRFADKFLRDAAGQLAGPKGDADAICQPLLNEIGRLSSVILSTKDGWQTIPLQQAIDGKLLDEGDATEAVNASVFFICVWHVSPKAQRGGLLQTGTELWGAQRSSLQPTEWIASLPTSTATAPIGATARTEAPRGGMTLEVQGMPPTS